MSQAGQEGSHESAPLLTEKKKNGEACDRWNGSLNIFSSSIFGPGLLCCLADTDFGCLIVAAESGARWGYRLLLLQVLLIPILFAAQELTIRLGVHTQQGHTACIKAHFGNGWAWFATVLLWIECVAAMVSEMSGISAVAQIWGLPRWMGAVLAAAVIIFIVVRCNYKQVEKIGITLGLFELTFVLTMFLYHPSPLDVWRGSFTFSTEPEYLKLVSSNMGAVIMPWMIYFQQSAIVARGFRSPQAAQQETASTFFGCCLTQLVMIGTLVTLAAAHADGKSLKDVNSIVDALAPQLGMNVSKVLVSLAFVGGSGCAAFVVSLAASWALCEATGVDKESVAYSLDARPTEAPYFYGSFLAVVLFGVVVLMTGVDVVRLNIYIELMDGVMLPFALGFLFLLATSDVLPEEVRLVGWSKWFLGSLFTFCILLSLGSAAYGFAAGDEL